MARERFSAFRVRQEVMDSTNDRSWRYPPGSTQTQHQIPAISIPQAPSPVARVCFGKSKAGDWTFLRSGIKDPHFEKHLSRPYPLILKDLSQKPINVALEDDMTRFYDDIAIIQENLKTYNDNISRISEAHSRSLDSMDWATARRATFEVQTLMAKTRKLGNDLRLRITDLHVSRRREGDRETQIRKQQAALLKSKLIDAIQYYQQMEQYYRHRYKQRLEKQLKIVNPKVTSQEVQAVISTHDNNQAFTEMFKVCNRLGESRTVLREVQERHSDIQKIEKFLVELAQLLNDVDLVVMTQGKAIGEIKIVTDDIKTCADTGYTEVSKAVSSARAHRKRKWLCITLVFVLVILFTTSIIIMIVAITNGNL